METDYLNHTKQPYNLNKNRDIELMRRLAGGEERMTFAPISIFSEGDESGKQENITLLNVCRSYWDALDPMRRLRTRTRNYLMNEQYKDLIRDDCGGYISEERYLHKKGVMPIKQNILLPIFNNLKGQFRQSQHKPVVSAVEPNRTEESKIMTNTVQGIHRVNQTEELDSALLGEFMISGFVAQRLGAKFFDERRQTDIFIENIAMPYMFWNIDARDVRLSDIKLIGVMRDMHLQDVILDFGKYSSVEYVKQAFQTAGKAVYDSQLGKDRTDNISFYTPASPHLYRVYEIWHKRAEHRIYVHDRMNGTYEYFPIGTSGAERGQIIAAVEAENTRRIQLAIENNRSEMERIQMYNLPPEAAELIDETKIPLIEYGEKMATFWYVKYLTPLGYCLYEGYSPFSHNEHPFIISMHPFIDGTAYGLLSTLLDQQRYVNRLVMLLDMILSTAAKGVLMVPEDIVPAGMSKDEFAQTWVKHDGVVFYTPKPHAKIPEQISTNSTNIGIHEIIQMQLNWVQDISGVHSAIQGKDPKAGTAASLYAQETANAAINSLDFITTFFNFMEKRDWKVIKLAQQFYTSPRTIAPTGGGEMDKLQYDPAVIANIEFNNSIDYVQNYGVYSQMINETMIQLLQLGVIDGQMLLRHSTIPNREALLQDIQQMNEQQAAMQQQMMAQQAMQQQPQPYNNV